MFQYHLSTLSYSQQRLYGAIVKKLHSRSSTVRLPLVHANELSLVYEAILLDNPDIFYTEGFQYMRDLNKSIVLKPTYRFSANEIRQHCDIIMSSLSFVDIAKDKTDYEKVLTVHDAILANVGYDYSFSGISNSVLGVAKNRLAVCEGIAKYIKMALDALSVKCIVVTGWAIYPSSGQSVSEAHAWNMVEVNGNWYHLDVTFDLTLKHKINRYDYFLVRDDEIQTDHSTGVTLPLTATRPMDFYYMNGLAVAKSVNLEQLICDHLSRGKQIMQFKLLNVRDGLNPSDKVLQIAQEQCQRLINRPFSVRTRYSSALWVFELEIV